MDDQNTTDNQSKPDSGSSTPNENSVADSVKKRALEALVPLLDGLNEAPERKFELIMTTLRSSEDVSLLENALQAALQIEEPVAKAEALIDIVSEAGFQEQQ